MTDLRQAAQQALEALETLQGGCTDSDDGTVETLTVWCPEVINALKAALEQPEQEPVKLHEPVISAWSLREVYFDEDGEPSMHRSPPAAQRPWQGLTEQDMPSGEDPMFDHQYFIAGMVYAAKVLQEKNT